MLGSLSVAARAAWCAPLLRPKVGQLAPRSLLRSQPVLRKAALPNTTPLPAAEAYPKPMAWFHWGMAGGTLLCFGLVQAAMQTKGKRRGELMFWHKSVGVALGVATVGRLATRASAMLSKKIPPHLPGPAPQKLAGSAAHAALYFFMIGMPASGIAMGYFGGKGLPFFFTTLPGTDTPNKQIAGGAFKFHKNAGQVYEYLVPLHAGASVVHVVQGHRIFSRMSIFSKPAQAASKTL